MNSNSSPTPTKSADQTPPVVAQAIWAVMKSMTRWEPLAAAEASLRLQGAAERLGLAVLETDPQAFRAWASGTTLESFVGALVDLRSASRSYRRLALQGALEVALGTGSLPLAQNLALRTVAEALAMDAGDLADLFQERTGAALPVPWDPSACEAWQSRKTSGSATPGDWDDAGPHPTPPESRTRPRRGLERVKALAVLGLDETATREDIKRAYHRISKVHHPDHYIPLGPTAEREATEAFRRISDAYDFLIQAEP